MHFSLIDPVAMVVLCASTRFFDSEGFLVLKLCRAGLHRHLDPLPNLQYGPQNNGNSRQLVRTRRSERTGAKCQACHHHTSRVVAVQNKRRLRCLIIKRLLSRSENSFLAGCSLSSIMLPLCSIMMVRMSLRLCLVLLSLLSIADGSAFFNMMPPAPTTSSSRGGTHPNASSFVLLFQ